MKLALIIIGALALTIGAMELRRRLKKKNAAPRATRGGLVLERNPARPASNKAAGAKRSIQKLAGPALLGFIFVILAGWMAYAYFTPPAEDNRPAVEAGIKEQPPQELVESKVFSGLVGLNSGDKAKNAMADTAMKAGADAKAATPPAVSNQNSEPETAGSLLTAAARETVNAQSKIGQVGQMVAPGNTQATGGGAGKNTAKPQEERPADKAQAQKPGGGEAAGKPRAEQQAAKVDATTKAPTKTSTPPSAGTPSGTTVAIKASGAGGGSKPGDTVTRPKPDNELLSKIKFTVHVGSFLNKDNAERYKASLTASGAAAFISSSESDGKVWYRVMSGSFSNKTDADVHARDLKKRGLLASGNYVIRALD